MSRKRNGEETARKRTCVKLDYMNVIEPLTDNQKKFFDAYRRGDYFIALHGVAGTGKTFIAF